MLQNFSNVKLFYIELISHSTVVFDKAYNYYHQFALWTQNHVYFVTRIKSNAVYTVIEVKRSLYRKEGQAKVLSDEIIELEYHPEDENGIRNLKIKTNLRLRKVSYQDERNRYFEFLTKILILKLKKLHSFTRKDVVLSYCLKR